MPTLNDILTANGDYTPVSGYPIDDKYEDDSPVINVYDRTIGEIVGDTSTSGENVSQYLTFRIPRHPDHYDLIENGTNIRILYRLEDDTGEDVVPVNVVANEDYIIFGWKIPLVVTVNPGVVTFIIHAYKSENNIITYHYKTLPKTYMILETMETDVVVPEIEMYNLAEAYARGTITDVFGHTRPVEEGEPGYHDNSKYYKELAGTSKIDAETAKNAAEVAQGAAETAQQAAENARDQAVAIVGGEYVSYGQTQSLNDTQKNKARENIGATAPNGYYPNMTVGLLENFVGTGEPTRRIFNYDTAGGSADISDGNAEIEKMYGDTVAWNQLIEHGNFDEAIGWTGAGYGRVTVANNIGSLTLSDVGGSARLERQVTPVVGHKFLTTIGIKTPYDTRVYTTFQAGASSAQIGRATLTANTWATVAGIRNIETADTTSGVIRYYINDNAANVGDIVQFRNAMLFDLTQMFGSTIADHIYSLEQDTAGAGVAWFKKLFPLDYYPYDEGTLLNVNPAGIKTVGFNAYDKATGKAELIGGNQYQITGTYTSLSYSTGEVLTPDSTGCFTPTKTGELTVTGGGENTCVHLTWSGYRNGDYEDYWTRTRDINVQPYFPDGLKRVGTVGVTDIIYDEISKDKAIKRIGVVDLGTLNWVRLTDGNYPRFASTISRINRISENLILVCTKYTPISGKTDYSFRTNNYNKCITNIIDQGDGYSVAVQDSSYTDASTFKASLSGVYLYYELETPIETQIDPPLNLLYQVSDFGTEQFLGAGATEPKTLPIIADIVYDVNYRDTIKNLPKNYAKVRGYYPDLYTGLADNLIDRKGNGTPQDISYRTSCGDDSIADDGNGIIQSILGKTVVWNQLWDYEKTYKESGLTYTYENHFYDVVKDTTAHNGMYVYHNFQPNNKYYVSYEASSNDNIKLSVSFGNSLTVELTESNKRYRDIITTNTSRTVIYLYSPSGIACTYRVGNIKIINLTQMFGAGNEPSTLDDPRINWIEDYANKYPEYNSGELISYNGSGIKTVGFNQFDKDNPSPVIHGYIDGTSMSIVGAVNHSIYYIPCLPNTTYCASRKAISTNDRFGIADMNDVPEVGGTINGYSIAPYSQVVGNDMVLTLTTGANAKYLAIWAHWANETDGTETLDTLCINFSWSGYRNGEYEPYWSRTLNLPISTYFPDGMKSAGSVRDEITKDKAVKRIGVVEIGSLPLVDNGSITDGKQFGAYVSGKKVGATNIFSSAFVVGSKNLPGIMIGRESSTFVSFNSSITTLADFKAAMSGVMLYYELAEPIETTITPPLDLTYKVADFGTEESIAEGKSTPFIGIIKYSDDFTRGLVNMPKNYDTTASLDALAASLSAMLTSALDGTVTITRGAYDPATKKYEWSCQFTKNQVN